MKIIHDDYKALKGKNSMAESIIREKIPKTTGVCDTPTALVTGSSRGIGLGIAKSLARQGFNIILNAPRESEALRKAEKEMLALEVKVKTIILDISDIAKHQCFVDQVYAAFGGLNCLVNNAGVSVQSRGDLLDITPESFDEQIDVNLRGTFFLSQVFAKKMLEQDEAGFRSIITISSSNAVAASIERGEYCMAKSALSMMNKLFALRLAPKGINCYELRPGLIETDMTKVAKPKYDALLKEGFSPINRWGNPEDVGEAVAALATGSMRFSTGDIVHIDGGLLLQRY
jgi:NAD(P)-dependent dehydrogenase (short-subunit alcohol dehydrogenase family)